MSRKICRHCNGTDINLVGSQGAYKIICGTCKASTDQYATISGAWADWCYYHKKQLSFACPICSTKILTRWNFCPECGFKIPKVDENVENIEK